MGGSPAQGGTGGGGGGAGGGEVESVTFSISHGGGDGDFKLTAAMDSETFSLATVLSGIEGSIQSMSVDCVEAFNNLGTSVGFNIGPEAVQPSDWFAFQTPSLPPEGFSLHNTGKYAGPPAINEGIAPRTDIGGATAPQVTFDTSLGGNVDQATTGKVNITIHYIPIP